MLPRGPGDRLWASAQHRIRPPPSQPNHLNPPAVRSPPTAALSPIPAARLPPAAAYHLFSQFGCRSSPNFTATTPRRRPSIPISPPLGRCPRCRPASGPPAPTTSPSRGARYLHQPRTHRARTFLLPWNRLRPLRGAPRAAPALAPPLHDAPRTPTPRAPPLRGAPAPLQPPSPSLHGAPRAASTSAPPLHRALRAAASTTPKPPSPPRKPRGNHPEQFSPPSAPPR